MGVRFPALKTVVTIFVLVLGNSSPVSFGFILEGITLSQVANAAAQAVTAGTSLATTSLASMAANFGVTCSIQVENWTRYPLTDPRVRMNGNGNMNIPPTTIAPGKREAFAVHKPRATATGVSGTVSWLVGDTGRRFVLMWSVPYDFNFHSNWMGLGMTPKGVTHMPYGDKWFQDMYYERKIPDMEYDIGEFLRDMDSLVFGDSMVKIEGHMSNTYKAQIKVTFRPADGNWDDLAGSFQNILRNNRNNGGRGGG